MGIDNLPEKARGREEPRSDGWRVRMLGDCELFDDDGLAETIASIIRNNSESADELTLYLLIILDAAGETAPQSVRRVIEQSVRLAFQSTETFAAALDLYTLGQRGLLSGPLPAKDLIRELAASLGQGCRRRNYD